ncbi:MAG: hypothetical protein HZC36_14585 [Armatimonadetes bacterium]|nr:hypothetical protein [Armatimonadota bacterium]
MYFRRSVALLLVLSLFAAQGIGVSARREGSLVFVNELAVLRFRTGRADLRAASCVAALGKASGKVKAVRKGRSSYQVLVGSRVVATATKADARAARATLAEVAGGWAAKLREALALPALSFDAAAYQAPAGGAVFIPLRGSMALAAKVASDDAETLKVRRVSGGVEVMGARPGTVVVSAISGKATATASVAVLPYAARLPSTVTVYVSGSPANHETVSGAIERAIRTQLQTVPGAKVVFDPPKAKGLRAGGADGYQVKVRASAQDAFEREGYADVIVRNLGLANRAETALWYSNDPENVPGLGTLFSGDLAPDQPTRLLYHHMNATPGMMSLQVFVANDTEKPARILIVEGDGGKDLNPVVAGCLAGERFVRNWLTGSGELVDVPARHGVPLSLHEIAPKVTSSGLFSLWLLPGGAEKLQVRVESRAPFSASGRWAEAVASYSPWRILGAQPMSKAQEALGEPSAHVYPTPFREIEAVFKVGGAHGFIRVGERAIGRADGKSVLEGNFGVCYKIKARFENPTASSSECELIYETSAGYSGGVFVVDGQIVRSPLLAAKSELRLATVKLEPGASKDLSVITFPLSGCSYPVTLTLRESNYRTNLGSAKPQSGG